MSIDEVKELVHRYLVQARIDYIEVQTNFPNDEASADFYLGRVIMLEQLEAAILYPAGAVADDSTTPSLGSDLL